VDYSISAESTDRDYLTKDEIRRLLDLKFRRKSMELVRDLYVFCCFIGLSFTDMKNLIKDNLQTSFDGKLWIMTKRQKTGVESNIMLLDIPKQIIEKYDGMARRITSCPFRSILPPARTSRKSSDSAVSKKRLRGIPAAIPWRRKSV
jgi:putative bacteriophage integrase